MIGRPQRPIAALGIAGLGVAAAAATWAFHGLGWALAPGFYSLLLVALAALAGGFLLRTHLPDAAPAPPEAPPPPSDRQRELEQAHEALRADHARERELNRLKDGFLDRFAHGLRQALSRIVGLSDRLLEQELSAVERRGHLLRIQEEGLAQLRRVDDLLSCYRAGTGPLPLRPRPVPLAQSLTAVLQLVEPDVAEADLQAVLDVPPEIAPALVDPGCLQQILRKLLHNAIRFTPRGGRIVLRARPWQENLVAVSVADSGVGIPAADLPRVFDKFWSGEQPDGGKPQGFGLGLAIARNLVEEHRGTIWAESEPGRGTTVTFTLPAVVGG